MVPIRDYNNIGMSPMQIVWPLSVPIFLIIILLRRRKQLNRGCVWVILTTMAKLSVEMLPESLHIHTIYVTSFPPLKTEIFQLTLDSEPDGRDSKYFPGVVSGVKSAVW